MASVDRNGADGVLERDDQGPVVGGLGGVDHLVAVAPERALVVADAQQAEGGVSAVIGEPSENFASRILKRVGQPVVGDLPALGQARLQLGAGLVDADQHVIDVGEHPEVDVLRRLDRVEGGRVLAAADGQHAGGLGDASPRRTGRPGTATRPIRIHLLVIIAFPFWLCLWVVSSLTALECAVGHLRRSKQRLVRVDMRNGGDQRGGIGMLRPGEDLLRRGLPRRSRRDTSPRHARRDCARWRGRGR